MALAQDVLAAIAAGQTGLDALAATLGGKKHALVGAVLVLKNRGLIVIDAPGVYRLTEAGADWLNSGATIKSGKAGPRPRQKTRGLRQRAWWVLRARRQVTLPDLLSTLADGSEKGASINLYKYLRALEKTGFVVVLANKIPGVAKTSNGFKCYRLARNNGRLAPVHRQKAGEVFDPNTGAVFTLEGVGHDASL